MGRNYPVYGSHAYAEGHFIHVAFSAFWFSKRAIIDWSSVSKAERIRRINYCSLDLGVFQHSYSSNKQDKGNDAYFPTFRQEQKEPQPAMGTAMADRVPDINRP